MLESRLFLVRRSRARETLFGRHDGRGLGCRTVCLSTPHRMAPSRENAKFTFFSLQLVVARGRKIDAKKVSEFYAKLPWESSLHHAPVLRYRGQIIVGKMTRFSPQLFSPPCGENIFPTIIPVGFFQSQHVTPRTWQVHHKTEERLNILKNTEEFPWCK